jgi:hypothetical protein
MKKLLYLTLSLIAIGIAIPVCADALPDETERAIAQYYRNNIGMDDYNKIKSAVFQKKGKAFEQQFSIQYPEASDAAVRSLSDQFDEYDACGNKRTYNTWLKTCPPMLPIYIDNKCYQIIESRITDIIVEHKTSK